MAPKRKEVPEDINLDDIMDDKALDEARRAIELEMLAKELAEPADTSSIGYQLMDDSAREEYSHQVKLREAVNNSDELQPIRILPLDHGRYNYGTQMFVLERKVPTVVPKALAVRLINCEPPQAKLV